jgi:inorganic pyrophosphatase
MPAPLACSRHAEKAQREDRGRAFDEDPQRVRVACSRTGHAVWARATSRANRPGKRPHSKGIGKPMRIDLIPTGDNPPESLNVIIEVPTGGEPVKYEFDKESGALFVDRILHTPMRYPANYGFVPHTLSPDGDPLDALVISRSPFIPGCVVRARPIGVLNLEDEHGGDEKLVCVPIDTTFPYYSDVAETKDLPSIIFAQIEHFFTHYKDLEKEKWVRIGNWGDAAEAKRIILESIEREKQAKG